MAAERLTQEVQLRDLPRIELGAFNWQPVNAVVTPSTGTSNGAATSGQNPIKLPPNKLPPNFLPADPLTPREFPLNMLENKTFAGTGYNVVWRPRDKPQDSSKTTDKSVKKDQPDGSALDVLELNLTAETLAFSGNIGNVPNRGANPQLDVTLRGIPYIQRVGAFEDDATGLNSSKTPVGIHFEPGVFMFVPTSNRNPAGQPATINRMASIPHGTTINAQGGIQPAQIPGKPDFTKDEVSIFPFTLGAADPVKSRKKGFDQVQLKFGVDQGSNRLPEHLTNFDKASTITQPIFEDPNKVLVKAIADQNIVSFVRLDLTTSSKVNPQPKNPITANDGIVGGGTANIGFLQGSDDIFTKDSPPQPNAGRDGVGNAHAAKMTVTYWIETLSRTLNIKPKTGNDQVFPTPVSAAGVLGPTFIVPKEQSDSISSPVDQQVFWTQVQYSQNVTLNFNGLSWPHVSVATLGEISDIQVTIDKKKS